MKKILVPCDFSGPAIQAYKFAMDIACASQGEVLVLKVIDLPFLYESAFGTQPIWQNPPLDAELEQQSRSHYDKMKTMHAQITAPVSFSIERGPVASTILTVIREQKIDLVVMGTQGAGGSEHFPIGTNTVRIVRSSPVPVISLRKAVDISAIRNIVFPVTAELNQTEFVSKIKAIQEFFNARLHLLLINTPINFHSDSDATQLLEEFAKHYKLKDYSVNFRNDMYQTEGIVKFASEVKADMIAMGTHGRKGIPHALFGSIAEDVVKKSVCPVWTSNLAS